MEKTQQRIEYLDYGKAVAITVILIAHVVHLWESQNFGIFFEALGWCGCPLFFMISGALRITNPVWSWKKYFFRIAKMCIVFFLWKLIYYLAGCFAYPNIPVGKGELAKYLFTVSYAVMNFYSGNIWFIYALLFLEFFSPIFNIAFNSGRQGKQVLLFTAVMAWLFSSFIFSVNMIFGFLKIPVSLNSFTELNPFGYYGNFVVYYVLGAFLFQYRERINSYFLSKKFRITGLRIICVLALLLGTAILIYCRYIYSKSITKTNMPIVGGYLYSSPLLQTVAVFVYMGTLNIGKIRQIIGRIVGRRTLGLYYLQSLFLTGLPSISCTWPYYPGGKILLVIFIMALSLAVDWIMEKIPVVKNLVR